MAKARPQAVRRTLCLLLIMLVALPLGGCWDSIEINDRGIVSMMGFDRDEEGLFLVYIGILEPALLKGTERAVPVSVLSGKGPSIEEAVIEMQRRFIPRFYFGHLQWLIASERFAREGIDDLLAWINRSLDRRLSQSVLVADGSLKDLVAKAPPQAQRAMNVVLDFLNGKVGGSTLLGPFGENLAQAGRDPVAGSFAPLYKEGKLIRLDESNFLGLALFRDYKMVGRIGPDEAVSFLLLNGDLRGGYSNISVTNVGDVERATVTWHGAEVKRRARLEGSRVRFELSFSIRGRLSELKGEAEPYDLGALDQIEKAVGKALETEMRKLFQTLQALRVDSVGVGQLLHAKYPAYWRRVRADWNEKGYQQVELVIEPKVKIEVPGLNQNISHPKPDQTEEFGAGSELR